MSVFDIYKGLWQSLFGPNSASSPTVMTPMVVNTDGSINAGLTGTTNAVVATGNVASGVADSGNPAKVGGVYNSTPPSFSNGQRGDLQIGVAGSLKMELWGPSASFAVSTNNGNNDGNSVGLIGLVVESEPILFNGASFDRERNNLDTAALITLSAAAAGTTNSADQTNYHGRGVQVIVDITAASAMTLTVNIQGKDAASGKYYTILASAAFAGTGTNQLTVYPGGLTTANIATPQPLPRTWRVQAVVTGTSVSATIGASVIL